MTRSGRTLGTLAVLFFGTWPMSAVGQNSAQDVTMTCAPPQVIPASSEEPPARLVVRPPLAEPLASRGVVVITYCADHMRFAPVFGAGALTASPRIGHVHVTVDDAPWHWADASGTPIILRSLPPGRHEVRLDLVNANHEQVDTQTVAFLVPAPLVPRVTR